MSTTTPPSTPTYSEIAQIAQVSTMTVCNVMRGRECVRPEKRARVFDALRSLGVPATVVRQASQIGNRRRRTKSFLLLEAGFQKGALSSPVYADIVRGIDQRCAEHGWNLQVRYAQNKEEILEAARSFTGSGVFLFGPSADFTLFRQTDSGLHAVRLLGSDMGYEEIDRVGCDDEQVGRLAAQWLASKGCKKPVFIGSASRIRSKAFADYCQSVGLHPRVLVSDNLFRTHEQAQVIDAKVLLSLWKEAEDCGADGVFAFSDQLGAALYNLLYRLGRMPGDQVPVISCNREEPFLAMLHPRPASIDIHAREIGGAAVDLLIWRLDNPEATAKRTLLSPSLFEGDQAEEAT
jgi:DNA-binding LacI/PurR family transcriptional regulator